MSTGLPRTYRKEEEFLNEFYSEASAASVLMGEDWLAYPECNENERHQRRYFLDRGELKHLVFDSARVFSDQNGRFAHVDILLLSSDRVVTVRVSEVDGKSVAEKLSDKPKGG